MSERRKRSIPGCCTFKGIETGLVNVNYADIKQYDVANGPGVRVSLFVSGCTHHCKNCFNQETWDFHYGKLFTEKEQEQILQYLKPDYVAGLSLLGGEPFEPSNQERLVPLLRAVRETYPQKDIWCYTGYLFDTQILGDMCHKYATASEMLSCIDILVDGRFVEEKKNLKLRFRGSENQRIIDVRKSLEQNAVIHWEHENG